MTTRATRKPATRRPAPKKRPAAKRPKKPGVLDQVVAALPFTEEELRRGASWLILGVGCAAVLGVASWFGVPGMIGTAVAEGVGRAGYRVEQIQLTGINRADRMTVYAKVLEEKSRAMPLVDLKGVRDRLVQYGGWIEDARVSRRLPDTLVVHIVERTPAAVWQNNRQLMLIDASGVLLEPVSAEAMPDLPLVIGDGANEQEGAYNRLLATAPALKPQVKAATWVGNRRWDLTFTSGEKLQLPEGEEESARALVKFAELDGTQRLLNRGYLSFDMRDPDKMVVRTQPRATPPPTTSVDKGAIG